MTSRHAITWNLKERLADERAGRTSLSADKSWSEGNEANCRTLHTLPQQLLSHDRLQQYDTIEEFKVDWKADCGQLNQAHVAGNKKYEKKKLKQTNDSAS